MISLKKYLDCQSASALEKREHEENGIASVAIAAYSSALAEMGSCSVDACPGLGTELKQYLDQLCLGLSHHMPLVDIEFTSQRVHEQLRAWGRHTARHYKQKSDEVKELLIVMAKTAESVGSRDQRCAGQINEVTARLTAIASLEDLTQIRASIEKSAADLRTSIERMTEEGKTAIDSLREQVSTYRTRLEEAEEIASRDTLTGLRNRLCIENQIESRIGTGSPFCVAMVDVDRFKQVNDDHGHLIGDELLKQFAMELLSACRSTDLIGRWGGDEFIILLECAIAEATAQIERLSKWVCGNYNILGASGELKLRVDASIGLAEFRSNDAMKDLIARADRAMYEQKASSKMQRT